MDFELKEKSFGESVGAVFKLAAGSLGHLLLWFVLPVFVINIILSIVLMILQQRLDWTNDQLFQWASLGLLLPLLYISAIPSLLTYYMSQRYQGNREAGLMQRSFRKAFKKFLPLLGTLAVAVIVRTMGTVLLVVPGIILSLGWICIIPIVILENISVDKAMVRSWRLTKGGRLEILGLSLVFVPIRIVGTWILFLFLFIIAVVIIMVADEGNSDKWMFLAFWPLWELVWICMASLTAALPVVVYYNMKIRKEGLLTETLRDQFETLPEGAEL